MDATFIIWGLVFIVSMAVLVKSSDFFTDAAEKIGRFFGVPSFIVGVTIVALGTSLPELVSSVVSILNGESQIVPGIVMGSNIANICLIMGITAIFAKNIKITYNITHVDLPMLVGSAFLMAIMVMDRRFTVIEAIICLAGLVVYMLHTVSAAKEGGVKRKSTSEMKKLSLKPWLMLLGSGIFIFLGAKYTIMAIQRLADILKIGESVIAASAVALGTSLPELSVSISAARKGNPEMAVGNVLGSNVFNTFAVMGLPVLIGKAVKPGFNLIIAGDILKTTLPVMVGSTLLFYFITAENRITRWEGWLLLLFYVLYLHSLFGL